MKEPKKDDNYTFRVSSILLNKVRRVGGNISEICRVALEKYVKS